ncbi:MAG: hypothetical protein DDT19_02599 [Syntrophomonadaceae bacterium]|nr:hypothetical protein [Bacillota bacterium]
MNISNYPTGFLRGVLIRGVPIVNTYSGNVFWVSSTIGSNGNHGRTPQKPFATLNYAISRCRARNGDILIVMPGHTETLTTPGAVTCNVAGVSIIGLGAGVDRPTFIFASTTATIAVTAPSVTIENILLIPSVNAVESPIVVSASDCYLMVEAQDMSPTIGFVRAVLTTAAADLLTARVVYRGFVAGTTCVNAIRLVGCDTGRINVDFYGRASVGIVEFTTTPSHNVDIEGTFFNFGITNLMRNVVDTVTGSIWSVRGFDIGAGATFSGGSGSPIAAHTVVAADLQEKLAFRPAAPMTSGAIIFTIVGGPISIEGLWSECVTANDITASTLQYNAVPTVGGATAISGVSASLAGAAPGASVSLVGSALATAPAFSPGGPNVGMAAKIVVPAGTIRLVMGIGPTTGAWRHFLRYKPLAVGVTVT